MTEKEYRSSEAESYSSIKMFDSDRIKYYKKYITQDKRVEEEMSTAMKLGSLVDCRLFSADEFDDKFVVASCNAPTGQIGEFTEKLCNITMQSLDSNLVVTRDITEMMEEAFKAVKYDSRGVEVAFKKKDFNWLVANFIGTDAENYYKICRSQFGKIVVDMNLVTASENIIEELTACEWTKDIILAKTEKDIEVIDQLSIIFAIEGIPFKGMPDRVIINHKSKTIKPYDLKVTYVGENFPYNYWKMKYYLQVASYTLALKHWKSTRKELENYLILDMEFIVGSSNLNSNPLLYRTKPSNTKEGLEGFTLNSGRRYKGLLELVKEVQWHKTNQLWRNSKEVYNNLGRMIIKPFEESEI